MLSIPIKLQNPVQAQSSSVRPPLRAQDARGNPVNSDAKNRILRCSGYRFLFLLPLLFFSPINFAADNTDLYTFTSLTHKQRFYDLTSEFRCLVCQNQTLAESNAPFAEDMRKQILTMINQGESDTEIREFLVKRYGEFVRYKPPFNPSTYFLWIAPGMLLILGVLFVFFLRH